MNHCLVSSAGLSVLLIALLLTAVSVYGDSVIQTARTCSTGFFTSTGANCQECETENCEACYADPSLCSVCSKGFYLTPLQTCERCPVDHCTACATFTGLCTECAKGYGLFLPSVNSAYGTKKRDGECRLNEAPPPSPCSPIGFFTDMFGKCAPCSVPHCAYCPTAADSCEQCLDGYYMMVSGDCARCPGRNCARCTDTYGMCYGCPTGMSLLVPGAMMNGEFTAVGHCEAATGVQGTLTAAFVLLYLMLSIVW